MALRPASLLLISALLVVGCADEPAPELVVQPTVDIEQADFPRPNFENRTSLALLHNGKRLRVGDTSTVALALYPAVEGSTRIRSLPAGFPNDYLVRGWSIPQEFEGFGVVLYQDRVVAAMEQQDQLDDEQVIDSVGSYERYFGQPDEAIIGQGVRYWFWVREPHTLMLSTFQTDSGRNRMTAAVGFSSVLSRLGISREKARIDKDSVAQLRRARAGLPLENSD